MSFFGFDTTLPRDRGHPVTAPGFGQAPDPFAGLSRAPAKAEDDDDAYVLIVIANLPAANVQEIQHRFR